MGNIVLRLVKCFQIVFPDLTEEEAASASQISVKEWDSVATITLVNVIEDEFQIEMDMDALAEFDSFAAIRNCIAQQAEVS